MSVAVNEKNTTADVAGLIEKAASVGQLSILPRILNYKIFTYLCG